MSLIGKISLAPKSVKKIVFYVIVGKDYSRVVEVAKSLAQSKNNAKSPTKAHSIKSSVDSKSIELAKRLLFAPRLENPLACVKNDGFLSEWNRAIVVLEVENLAQLDRVKVELERLSRLYKFGLSFNLYIVYNEPRSYYKKMYERLSKLFEVLSYRKHMSTGSNVYLLNECEEPQRVAGVRARNLLKFAVKNTSMNDSSRLQDVSLNAFSTGDDSLPNITYSRPQIVKNHPVGGFTETGGFYVNLSKADTPRPFSNIMANKYMGTIVTESGGGFSFYDSSYYKKITSWSNDSVLDVPGEFLTIVANGQMFSLTKKPFFVEGAQYSARHELGFSEFCIIMSHIMCKKRVFLAQDKTVKYFELEIECADRVACVANQLEVSLNLNLVLGDFKQNTAHALHMENVEGGVCATNLSNLQKVYVSCSSQIAGYKTKNGVSEFKTIVNSQQGQKIKIIFAIGSEVVTDFTDVDTVLQASIDYYQNLSSVQIEGDSNEAIISKWLPYQVLNSRFYAKAGFYQAGGAIGFRDQLQDCLSILYVDPRLVRDHLIEASKRQFEKGDVLHWWHPISKGVRTLMTDDRLFLPLVLAEYIDYTQDFNVLDERTPYLVDRRVPDGQHSLYDDFAFSEHADTLLNHCLKAIEVSCDFGNNGLCKMGTGDWNDAMDRLGERGEGTSMFNSMLLYYVIRRFMPFVGAGAIRRKYLEIAEHLRTAIDESFEGDRYVRAYTDEGEAVGSKFSVECKLDMLVQSWAALSGAGDKAKTHTALKTVLDNLVDEKLGIAKLLAPPFEHQKNIGYIADYPPGVRENGGQYSHAAAWFVLALLKEDKIEDAYKIFSMMSPLNLTDTLEKQNRYKNEPYVLSADVYASGQGGWSWYTGAASWYYKCLIEGFLGIKKMGNKIWVAPKLPSSITEIAFSVRHNKNIYRFLIDNTGKKGDWKYKIDQVVYSGNGLDLNNYLANKKIVVVRG